MNRVQIMASTTDPRSCPDPACPNTDPPARHPRRRPAHPSSPLGSWHGLRRSPGSESPRSGSPTDLESTSLPDSVKDHALARSGDGLNVSEARDAASMLSIQSGRESRRGTNKEFRLLRTATRGLRADPSRFPVPRGSELADPKSVFPSTIGTPCSSLSGSSALAIQQGIHPP